jgi:phosphoribosylformimino-5-aminoimidazole carboxamide ribonucleotide (ProFAR) isomerase
MLPGPHGPEPARDASGEPADLFDVIDRLAEQYPRVYVVDLDGIERNRPQLDYLSELARSAELWVDAGARTGDQVIDILVAGARRCVLSSAHLASAREFKRAWKLSPEIVFEMEIRGGRLSAAEPGWAGRPPADVAEEVRAVGPVQFVLGFRDGEVDWALVREVSARLEGAAWVGGTFERSDAARLDGSGAAGGIFQLDAAFAAEPRGPGP